MKSGGGIDSIALKSKDQKVLKINKRYALESNLIKNLLEDR